MNNSTWDWIQYNGLQCSTVQYNAVLLSATQCSVSRHSGNWANNAVCEKIRAHIAKLLLWKYFRDGGLICFLHLIYFFLTFYCLIYFLPFPSPLFYLFIYLFTTCILCLFLCFILTPDGVVGIFHWLNPSGRTMALRLTQPLTERSVRFIFCGVRRPVCRADNITTFMCRLSWNLGASASCNPQGLSGLYRDCLTFTSTVTLILTFNLIDACLFLSLFLFLSSRIHNCHYFRQKNVILLLKLWIIKAKWSGMRRSEVRSMVRGGGRVFMEKVYRSSKWWEVKDWGESVSELMIGKKKQLQ